MQALNSSLFSPRPTELKHVPYPTNPRHGIKPSTRSLPISNRLKKNVVLNSSLPFALRPSNAPLGESFDVFLKSAASDALPRRHHGRATNFRASGNVTNAAVREDGEESNSGGLTYREAGVDIDAGSELVRRIAKMAPGIGGFGGLFPFGDSYLVAGTDGVGTKLKLAFTMNTHNTIGIDLVAMSVNDIITSGAKPLFFLDYFASSKLDVDQAEQVIKGIVDGCHLSDCVLLGGETAEMPGFYADGEYDLSGFAVGSVKKDEVIDGSKISDGDIIIGLPSSGVHSNGFSLVRRVLANSGVSLHDPLPNAEGNISIGEALLKPTVIYVKQVLEMIQGGGIKGIAHITGGGFTDNIPRIFPQGLGAQIHTKSWNVLPIFSWIQQSGRIDDSEMRRTFNLGIGMILVVSPETAKALLANESYSPIYAIGIVVQGEGVTYIEDSFEFSSS